MPGGESMRRLLAWVSSYVGLTLDWDVRLMLKKEERPPLRLGGATRIGWSTWLASAPADARSGPDADQSRVSLKLHQP